MIPFIIPAFSYGDYEFERVEVEAATYPEERAWSDEPGNPAGCEWITIHSALMTNKDGEEVDGTEILQELIDGEEEAFDKLADRIINS